MRVYAAYYNDEVRKLSSSGGMFSLIGSQFDIVYGIAMVNNCYGCEFFRVDLSAEESIEPLRGSKYIQAKPGDTYKNVKVDLEEGKKVLFTGTGCQINGLYHFLQKEYDNLVLLDVICHGVPSQMLWKEYVLYQENKHGKLNSINFRCKDKSWEDFGMKDNQFFISKNSDPYMQMFLRNYSLRPSCFECHAKYYKKADISLGDFWGIEDVAPEMYDEMGVSLVIARTEKGQKIFEAIKGELKYKEVSYEDGVRRNPPEYKSVVRPEQRDTFYSDMNKMPFEKLVQKYIEGPLWKKAGRKIKHIVKNLSGGGDR